jgi:hypothetical protein
MAGKMFKGLVSIEIQCPALPESDVGLIINPFHGQKTHEKMLTISSNKGNAN